MVLSLRYCAPTDLVRRALETLRVERGGSSLPINLELPDGSLPDVLLDRQQLTEALSILVASAVERSAGNIAGAARLLGINRSTLYYRMRKHGLL